jgi:hypothetical protein
LFFRIADEQAKSRKAASFWEQKNITILKYEHGRNRGVSRKRE